MSDPRLIEYLTNVVETLRKERDALDEIDARDTTIKELRQSLAMRVSSMHSLADGLESAKATIRQVDEEARAWETALKTLAIELVNRDLQRRRSESVYLAGMYEAALMCQAAIQAIDPDYKLPEGDS